MITLQTGIFNDVLQWHLHEHSLQGYKISQNSKEDCLSFRMQEKNFKQLRRQQLRCHQMACLQIKGQHLTEEQDRQKAQQMDKL